MTLAAGVLGADDTASSIDLKDVPLATAIKTLARQAELNLILDPHVPGSDFGPGRLAAQPSVTVRWTNVTAQVALGALLKEHQLVMVTNPATTVLRIAPTHLRIQPVPASQVGTNSGPVIPLLALQSVSLTEAVTRIAHVAGLTVSFDPKASAPALESQGRVSFRWERVTARQALAALLDNHGLGMSEDSVSGAARITLKPTIEEPGRP